MERPNRIRRKPGIIRRALGVLAVATTAACLYFFVLQKPKPPSIVFILIDTLRSDHMSCYGYERKTTPNIDVLAKAGVRFENAIAQSSWTLPSMISLMSGKYIFSKAPKLPEETPSLAQLLKRRGYRTAAFIANSLVGEKEGFAKGFDHFEIRQHKTAQWPAGDLNHRLLPYMKSSLEPPFFLYLHYLDPHFPYAPPEELAVFKKSFDPIPEEKRRRIADYVAEHPELKAGAAEDVKKMERQIDLYDGEVRFVDRCVGRILFELKTLGLDENTVILLAADHGECLWDHLHYPKEVEKRHAKDQRDLTIQGPGIQKGRVVKTMVENVDIIPTLLALAGEEGYLFGDGRNLLPVLEDPAHELPEKQVVYSHCNEATCAVQPTYRLKLLVPTNIGMFFGLDFTLFDLAKDPWELANKLREIPDASNHLLKAVKEKVESCYFKDKTSELDKNTKEKMKELGYTH
jgi:arylsulfatase A-like enzyme